MSDDFPLDMREIDKVGAEAVVNKARSATSRVRALLEVERSRLQIHQQLDMLAQQLKVGSMYASTYETLTEQLRNRRERVHRRLEMVCAAIGVARERAGGG